MRNRERCRGFAGMILRVVARLATGCILWVVAATPAAAQCALCGSGTPYAGSSPGQAYATLAAAALVLLVPVLGLLLALATVLRKYRD